MRDLLPAALAFAAGVLVGFLNSRITKAALKKGPSGYMLMPVRVIISALFVVALFIITDKLGLPSSVMIAGAVGLSISLIAFSLLIIKNSGKGEGKDEDNG